MNTQQTELSTHDWEGYRLSLQQERLWSLQRSHPSYWTIAHTDMLGPLDRAVFTDAVAEIFDRHEILRTSIKPVLGEAGAALMLVADSSAPALFIDLTSSGADEQDRMIAEHIEAARERPLDTSEPQPVRVAIFSRGPDLHTLVLTAPRLCLDGRSAGLLFTLFAETLAAKSERMPTPPLAGIQYADFAQWQLNREDGAVPAPPRPKVSPLRLPMELAARDVTPGVLRWTAPAGTLAAITELAQQEGTSPRTVLLACWQAALWRAGGRPEHLAVEAALACRPFAELADALGSFESYAPLEVEIPVDPTVQGMISAAAAAVLSIEEDQWPARATPEQQPDPNRVGFNFAEWPERISAGHVSLTRLQVDAPTEPLKLELMCVAAGDVLDLAIRYNVQGFAPTGIEAIACALRAALAAAVASPQAPINALPLLDVEAAAALIASSNPSAAPLLRQTCWHQAFAEQARRTPDAIALEYDGRRWTYDALDRLTNRMARALRRRGVMRGSLVGLMLERSDVAIAALIAILKAGGAYVPLDPGLPVLRRQAILAEVAPALVVCNALQSPTAAGDPPQLRLDLDRDEIDNEADNEIEDSTEGGDLAYVLFTSGSTGVPKGVAIEHAQLMHYVDGAIARLGFAEPSRCVVLGSLATDLGNTAIFPALCTGGSLDIVPVGITSDAQALAAHLASRPYDVLKITPTHLAALVDVADMPAMLLPRQSLVLGGEALSWGMLRLFRSFANDCRIFNHYGPTETCVGVLAGEITSDAVANLASTVPLGQPLMHARAYVVDEQGRPVPSGLPGELWIGGETVARGYLTPMPGTAERFLPDPWEGRPGARMYKSGDLVRQLPDGTIEFLGRIDRQVKVRGFRVELAEIEAVLRQHTDVMGSLVVKAGESGSTHLIAYVITESGETGSAEWLRPYLQDRLPDFMIPAHLVSLARFPLNAAGKIDAGMLPDPASIRTATDGFAAPRTETEKAIAAIFSDLLFVEQVGVDDDFFEIGGHSLLATRLLSRLRADFPVKFTLRAVFESPTVEGLSAAIDAKMTRGTKA